MRPGTAPVDVEEVAVFLGGELGVGVAGDEVAKLAVLAAELAIFVSVFVDFCLGLGSVFVLGTWIGIDGLFQASCLIELSRLRVEAWHLTQVLSSSRNAHLPFVE